MKFFNLLVRTFLSPLNCKPWSFNLFLMSLSFNKWKTGSGIVFIRFLDTFFLVVALISVGCPVRHLSKCELTFFSNIATLHTGQGTFLESVSSSLGSGVELLEDGRCDNSDSIDSSTGITFNVDDVAFGLGFVGLGLFNGKVVRGLTSFANDSNLQM